MSREAGDQKQQELARVLWNPLPSPFVDCSVWWMYLGTGCCGWHSEGKNSLGQRWEEKHKKYFFYQIRLLISRYCPVP